MTHRLKKEVKELIKNNNVLSAEIADELCVKNTSIPVSIFRDSVGLLSLPVLEIIARHTGRSVHDLIERVSTDSLQPTN